MTDVHPGLKTHKKSGKSRTIRDSNSPLGVNELLGRFPFTYSTANNLVIAVLLQPLPHPTRPGTQLTPAF